MSALLLAQSDNGAVVLLVIGGLFVAAVIAVVFASMHEQRKEDRKPKSRSLGFAPREKPEPEPTIPDRIRPVSDDAHRRPREGPIEPPPDSTLPSPRPKMLPPGEPQ